MVACDPTVKPWTRRRFTPCVVLPPKVIVPVTEREALSRKLSVLAAVPVRVTLAKTFPAPPPMRAAPEPLNTIDIPFQFRLPPLNRALAPDIVRVAVLAGVDRLVGVLVSQLVPPAVIVIALAPSVRVRVFEFELENDPHEHVCPLVFSVPVVNVIAPVSVVPALCRSVRSDLLMVMEAADRATSTVTVAAVPELESKVTLSPATGTVSPPAPPVVADQWAVSLVFPVPSTQNLLAMVAS